MRRWGGALISLLLLPGLSLPYAKRVKVTIGPSSPPLAKDLPCSTKIVIVPAPIYSPPPYIVVRPAVVYPAPAVTYPAIYPAPVPVYSPSYSSPSTGVADILFMQALLKLGKEVEELRDEVRRLKEQVEAPRCPTCGRPMRPEWKICPYDGTPLPKGPEARRPVAPEEKPRARKEEPKPPAPERKEEKPELAPKPERRAERPAEEAAGQGWVVDWDRNLMRAVGRASLDEARGDPERARRLALERAYDALREGLLDLWGRRKVEGVDPYTWAAELTQHAKVTRERELPDGTWEVEVELKFGEREAKPEEGKAIEAVTPAEKGPEAKPRQEEAQPEAAKGIAPAVKEAPRKVEEPERKEEAKATPVRGKGPFTGLIVDARGLGLKPAMSPKIWDENGRLVWQKVKVSTEFVLKKGIVAYAHSMEEALKSPRAGKNPLVVKAVGVRGPFKADPVLSAEDADLVLEENKRTKFLDKCNVVFVLD